MAVEAPPVAVVENQPPAVSAFPAGVAGTQVGDRVVRRRITGTRSAGRTAAEVVASLAALQDLKEKGCLNEAQFEGLRVRILRGH